MEQVGNIHSLARWLVAIEAVNGRLNRIGTVYQVIIDILLISYFLYQVLFKGDSWLWLLVIPGIYVARWVIDWFTKRRAKANKDSDPGKPSPARDAHVAERIITGEINGNEISKHSGWPFNLIFKPLPEPTPEQTIGRVTFALDWYCAPPKEFSPNPGYFVMLPMLLMMCFPLMIDFSWQKIQEEFYLFFPAVFFVGLAFQVYGQSLSTLIGEFDRITGELSAGDPVADSLPAGDASTGPELKTRYNQLLPALNQISSSTGKVNINPFAPYTLLTLSTAFIGLMGGMGGGGFISIVVVPVVILSAMVMPVAMHDIYVKTTRCKAYRAGLRRRIEESGLTVRIAEGDTAELFSRLNIPPVYRLLSRLPACPKSFSETLLRDIWRAGSNLDWFLDPPAVAVRPWWWLLAIQAAGIVVIVVTSFYGMNRMYFISVPVTEPWFAAHLAAIGLVIACAFPGWIHDVRMAIWREELIEALRVRLRD